MKVNFKFVNEVVFKFLVNLRLLVYVLKWVGFYFCVSLCLLVR